MLAHPDIVPLRVGAADLARLRVDRADGSVRLTPIEARLLGHLASRSPAPVSRQELLEVVWGYAPGIHTRTVAVTVHTLRSKIEGNPSTPLHVLTIRGEGYRFVPAPTEAPVLLEQLAQSASLDPVLRRQLLLARVSVVGYDDPAAALALLDQLPGARMQRVGLLSDLGRLDEAAAELDAALATAPPREHPQLNLEAALLARRAGDIPRAIAGMRAVAAAAGPDDVRARACIRLGAMLLDEGDIEDGFAALAAARAILEPLDAPRLLAVAWGEAGLYSFFHGTLAETRDALERAVSCATRAQSLYVERVAWAGLALVSRLLGDDAQADRERRRGNVLAVARWCEPGLHGFLAKERFIAGATDEGMAEVEAGLARHAIRPHLADYAQLMALKAVWSGGQLSDAAEVLRAHNPSLYRALIVQDRPPSEALRRLFQLG